MASHATAAELRAYAVTDLTADQPDAELTRLLSRASDNVDDAITEEPDLGSPAEVAALNRATMLTAESLLAVGEEATLTGQSISIGHVSIGAPTTTGGSGGSRARIPDSAVQVLRSAGLIRAGVSAL